MGREKKAIKGKILKKAGQQSETWESYSCYSNVKTDKILSDEEKKRRQKETANEREGKGQKRNIRKLKLCCDMFQFMSSLILILNN